MLVFEAMPLWVAVSLLTLAGVCVVFAAVAAVMERFDSMDEHDRMKQLLFKENDK